MRRTEEATTFNLRLPKALLDEFREVVRKEEGLTMAEVLRESIKNKIAESSE